MKTCLWPSCCPTRCSPASSILCNQLSRLVCWEVILPMLEDSGLPCMSTPSSWPRQSFEVVMTFIWLCPWVSMGDGVRYMQTNRAGGKTLEVLSWCSLLNQNPTKVSSFLMLLIVKNIVKDTGFDKTWTKAWKILCRSLAALASGRWCTR